MYLLMLPMNMGILSGGVKGKGIACWALLVAQAELR
jgi:hypothetical protein